MVVNRILLFVILLLAVTAAAATPKIQQWQTSNGANVLYVHAPELPMLDMRIVFDAGSARDGDLPGLAMLTNSMLTEGAGQWDADQIAERIESVGANLSTDSLRDMGLVSLRTLTDPKALKKSVETLATILAEPVFKQEAMDRNLEAMKISLRSDLQSPSTIASKAFFRVSKQKSWLNRLWAGCPRGNVQQLCQQSTWIRRSFAGRLNFLLRRHTFLLACLC